MLDLIFDPDTLPRTPSLRDPMPHLERIRIAGFKSIRDQEVELGKLNVLIGANGAGKSNFIAAFRLLNRILAEELQLHVGRIGGADQLLHYGRKRTERIELDLRFRISDRKSDGYQVSLVPTAGDTLAFEREAVLFHAGGYPEPYDDFLGSGHAESKLTSARPAETRRTISDHVLARLRSWKVYHFHDTSEAAEIKQTADLDDNRELRSDAGNLPALLYRLRETDRAYYDNIRDTIRLAAPFFDDFDLEPNRLNPSKIKLEWRERGAEEQYFDASALSDGTLRFMALATLLQQPELPATILLDEPELGLHPFAITVLAGLLQSAAERTQVIVSTQSVTLVNQLSPEDLIVVDREDSASVFRRPDRANLATWLDEYALGEAWEKNLLGGRPGG